jgi:putative aldouronate transport system permease protein
MTVSTNTKTALRQRGRASRLLLDIWNTRYLQLMIIPFLIYFIIFKYIPIYGVTIAFKDYKVVRGIAGSPWVGLRHFMTFFKGPYFVRLVRNTLLLNVYNLVFTFPLPIIFALLLNEVRPLIFKKFVQTVSYLPHFISLAAVIGMLVMFVSPGTGIVNKIITALGGEAIYFMAEPRWFRPLYVISGVWIGLGWSAIIYIAALAGVDVELYEAASIDGATRVKLMWHVSLPSIKNTVVVMLILRIGQMMSLGAEKVLLMYNELTFDTADVISTFVYRRGLQYAEYSFSTAVDVFNSIINIILLVTANSLSRKYADSSLW